MSLFPEAFEECKCLPHAQPMDTCADHIAKVGKKAHGGAGLSGMDAVELQNWPYRFQDESVQLQEEMAAWISLLKHR